MRNVPELQIYPVGTDVFSVQHLGPSTPPTLEPKRYQIRATSLAY